MSPILDWLPPLLAAPFAGSFAGVLIRRLPAGRPMVFARSACEACGAALGPLELVPLASFAVLRGRCRVCRAPIARFHPAVELAALAVAASAVLAGARGAALWAGCGLGWTLLALAWIDWEHMRLPDMLTLPLIVAGLLVTVLLDPEDTTGHAAAAAAGYLAFRLLAALYQRLRRREGLGQGDAKLLAAAGAWVGLEGLPRVVVAGALISIAIAALRSGRMSAATAVPFGPGLALGCWAVWLGL
jgi:leader peptidase (prepilin peptidase)/N-methyltransferase